MAQRGWTETGLWKHISSARHTDSEVAATIQTVLPLAETILMKGGTGPSDFTLHDADHSFRVAERMLQVIPSEVTPALPVYEHSLLLLSAYLHDIGMTPERGRVTVHRAYLITGDRTRLSDEEVNRFQAWLDDAADGLVPPLCKGGPTPEELGRADLLITHYCRSRHNDWSEQWIREHLSGRSLGRYSTWVDDLIVVCRSHHEGYDSLRSARLDPIWLGGEPQVCINLRYTACVLRIADILEFDPERTPEVIFRHRDISPTSRIFWAKDQQVALVWHERDRMTLTARPTSAKIHRAVLTMAEEIDAELSLCRRLSVEKPFGHCAATGSTLVHDWDLPQAVYRNVEPRDAKYFYIEGAFRPNTQKLLELFAGTELYAHPIVAVREVLQNAFDAVREQIALERLATSSPADPNVAQRLAESHSVRLRLTEDTDGRFWLECRDDGVGMTRSMIENHLLVSGASRQHQRLDLERRCLEHGFGLGLTGQFGIGVLSYFMLGDRVEFRTRRSQATGDGDLAGWEFVSEGVGDFGELRQCSFDGHGTLLRMRLRHGADAERQGIGTLHEYLATELISVPCRVELEPCGKLIPMVTLDPGWTKSIERSFIERIDADFPCAGRPIDITETPLPSAEVEMHAQALAIRRDIRDDILRRVRWIQLSGTLDGSLGEWRLHVPCFELTGGECLAYFRITAQEEDRYLLQRLLSNHYVYRPGGVVIHAWKGMRVRVRLDEPALEQLTRLGFWEIELKDAAAGQISLNRFDLIPSERLRNAWMSACRDAQNRIGARLEAKPESAFHELNLRIAGLCGAFPPPYWLTSVGTRMSAFQNFTTTEQRSGKRVACRSL